MRKDCQLWTVSDIKNIWWKWTFKNKFAWMVYPDPLYSSDYLVLQKLSNIQLEIFFQVHLDFGRCHFLMKVSPQQKRDKIERKEKSKLLEISSSWIIVEVNQWLSVKKWSKSIWYWKSLTNKNAFAFKCNDWNLTWLIWFDCTLSQPQMDF